MIVDIYNCKEGARRMSNEIANRGEVLLYSDESGKEYVSVVFKDETFWLTQSSMAELFACTADNISLHLKNIYADGELTPEATTEKFSVVRKEGFREVTRTIDHYNLDAIIAVGYRVNSKKATRFRQWATKTLRVHPKRLRHQRRNDEKRPSVRQGLL